MIERIINRKGMITSALLAVLAITPSIAAEKRSAALIIDHNCTAISKVPAEYIAKAQKNFKVAYGHTSHGSQVVSGMEALRDGNPSLFAFGKEKDGLFFLDKTPKGDLGNPDRITWAERTQELLKDSRWDCNLVVWSWCGQLSKSTEQEVQTYLSLMSGLEKEFPLVTFVYMTGHLDGTGRNGTLNQCNNQIRAFCKANNKVLFDFADIESYDPDGKVNYMELNARDTCDYKDKRVTKNWATEWLDNNSEHKIALPLKAAHSKPLNAALKGQAFWWMLARLSGWSGI